LSRKCNKDGSADGIENTSNKIPNSSKHLCTPFDRNISLVPVPVYNAAKNLVTYNETTGICQENIPYFPLDLMHNVNGKTDEIDRGGNMKPQIHPVRHFLYLR